MKALGEGGDQRKTRSTKMDPMNEQDMVAVLRDDASPEAHGGQYLQDI